ncbi:MAG TPA: hypothetical protein VMF30_09455 [Pirellulales bacterium]|nr:hypothetical protein [Pirellulales bacterium]
MADKPKSKAKSAAGKAKAAKPAETKPAKAPKSAAKSTAKPAKGPAKAKKASKAAKPAVEGAAASMAEMVAAEPLVMETYYVVTDIQPLEIVTEPPAAGTEHTQFASFLDAREHLLEHLIATVEEYERLLHAVRGASSFADYDQRRS